MAGHVNFYLDESEVGSIRSRNSSIVPGNHYEVITRMEELRYAVLSEQVNVVRTLLKKVTERELHEYSEMANSFPIRRPLLHIAVLKKCPVILKLLLDKRIFQILINERDAEYYTPLMRAADVGSGECVRLLMDAGANTTLSVFKSPDDRHRSNQTSKFVRRRNNTATSSGTTATHIAAEGGYVDVLSLLVQKLDVRQGLEDPDSLGRTPLMVAVENGHVGCFNLLVNVGARYVDVVDYKYQTVLHLSAKKGKTEMLRELLRKPEVRKMVNDRDKQSFTALSWSVYNGYVDCMDELLDAGADQKVKDANNNTLLHLACFQGHSHVLKELLPYSLRFMKSTPQREETASLKKNPSSFSSMLTSHEDILNLRNHTRPSGRTVYWWYMRDLKQRNKQGSNCFHLASTSGDVKCLELLLSCFASPGHTDLGEIVCPDIREVDGYGLTPLYISARAGSTECVKFLIDYGGNLAFSSPVDSPNIIGASQEKVLDVLFQNVDNFDQLISEVLDECVDISTDIGSERKFMLDLSVLCPEGVNKMAVTKLLFEQNRTPSLKEHPLILAFIQLEWYPQKFVLWYRFVNYILFLACFSWYVAHPNLNESTDPIRWTLMPLTILVFMFVAPILLPGNGSMIFRFGKTTLMVIPAILSIITTSLPNGPQWKAISILITWLILPFYTNVIPTVGKQFAVFLNILREIFKYFIVLFSVLIGFSVSFYVLNKQYEDLTFGEFGKWFLYTSLILMRGGEDYQSNIHSNATIEYDLSNSISRVINEQKLADILIYLIFIFTVVFSLINMFIVIAFISGEKIILCSDNSFKRRNQVNMLFEKKELEKWLDWAFCKCGRKSTDVLSPTENIISVKTGIFSPEIDAGLWKIVTLRKNKVIKNRDDTEIKYEVDKVVEKKLQTMFKIISNQTLPSQNVDQKNIF